MVILMGKIDINNPYKIFDKIEPPAVIRYYVLYDNVYSLEILYEVDKLTLMSAWRLYRSLKSSKENIIVVKRKGEINFVSKEHFELCIELVKLVNQLQIFDAQRFCTISTSTEELRRVVNVLKENFDSLLAVSECLSR